MREKLLEDLREEISILTAAGFTVDQAADYLYDSLQISCIERDILKGE